MSEKVTIHFKAVGGAPDLPKGSRRKCNSNEPFERVVQCLFKELGHPVIFAYIRESFMPALEEEVGMLVEEYGTQMGQGSGKELVVQYSLKPNYGPHFVNLAEGLTTPSPGRA